MIDINNLSVQFTGTPLFENVNFKINEGDKICLVGPNGSGKTTLLKIIKGIEQPEEGAVRFQKGLRIGYLPQEYYSVKENHLFDEVKESLDLFIELDLREEEIHSQMESSSDEERANLINELGEIHHRKETVGYYSVDSEIEKVLEGLGFDQNDFQRKISEFSGGWIMRIELAKILLGSNDILLLDEPTNHLDIDSLYWLEEYLKSFRGALLIVSHDKSFINSITDKTLEIFNRKIVFFKGNYQKYIEFKAERDRIIEAERKNKLLKIKDTEKFIERFRYKATKAKQVQSRIKMLEKIEIEDVITDRKSIKINFPAPPRSGNVPVELKDISKSFGDNKVFDGVNFLIERGEKIAFVGPNGAGKTTLSRIIAGKTEVSSGQVIYGGNTTISFFSQEAAEDLDLDSDVISIIYNSRSEISLGRARSILGAFLFSDDDVFKKVGVLSGGEKARTALAKLLLTQANLIILDEPTNHLDYQSKDVLQRALMEFPGTLIIVSHDVDFLRPLVTKVVDIRDGKANIYPGGIDYFLTKRFKLDNSQKVKNTEVKQNRRKELKRKEAELRQKIFKATNKLKLKVEKIETKISELEDKKREVEALLASEKIYSSPDKLKYNNKIYNEVKAELENTLDDWAELTDKLERAFSEFKIEDN